MSCTGRLCCHPWSLFLKLLYFCFLTVFSSAGSCICAVSLAVHFACITAMKMSSAPSNENPSISDDYSYGNSVDYNDYNLQFTADISKHMQMPDRLAAVDGLRRMNFRADPASESFVKESAAFAMTMPEKIILGNYLYSCVFSLLW